MSRVWIVMDYAEFEIGDSREPRIVAVTDAPQLAIMFAHALNARRHPNADRGYMYDFRVDQHEVYSIRSGWTPEEIIEKFEVGP